MHLAPDVPSGTTGSSAACRLTVSLGVRFSSKPFAMRLLVGTITERTVSDGKLYYDDWSARAQAFLAQNQDKVAAAHETMERRREQKVDVAEWAEEEGGGEGVEGAGEELNELGESAYDDDMEIPNGEDTSWNGRLGVLGTYMFALTAVIYMMAWLHMAWHWSGLGEAAVEGAVRLLDARPSPMMLLAFSCLFFLAIGSRTARTNQNQRLVECERLIRELEARVLDLEAVQLAVSKHQHAIETTIQEDGKAWLERGVRQARVAATAEEPSSSLKAAAVAAVAARTRASSREDIGPLPVVARQSSARQQNLTVPSAGGLGSARKRRGTMY